jgi:esterase/lipase superfamily enzyme
MAQFPCPPPPPTLSAPQTSPAPAASTPEAHPAVSKTTYAVVRIFYATDRRITGLCRPSLFYGNVRGDDAPLSFGLAQVSIPKDHRPGMLESPSIWRHEDPSRDVVLLGINPFNSPEADKTFFLELSNQIATAKSQQVFVFIHGFDNTFEDAIRWTAQISNDIGFEGVPIVYSWPSAGKLLDYPADEATVEWTELHLKAFLEELVSQTHATTIHLIAHSMGNRALVTVLNQMALESPPAAPPKFNQVVLAAPDIDAGVFKQLAATFIPVADHVTIYVSSKDRALIASRKFHTYPRVGDSGPTVIIVPHVDTIDVSAVNTSFVGHSYLGDNRSILSDISHLIRDCAPPDKRVGMVPLLKDNQTYWTFQPLSSK